MCLGGGGVHAGVLDRGAERSGLHRALQMQLRRRGEVGFQYARHSTCAHGAVGDVSCCQVSLLHNGVPWLHVLITSQLDQKVCCCKSPNPCKEQVRFNRTSARFSNNRC